VSRTIALFIVLVSVAVAAQAQAQAPATSFAELQGRLSIGETVFVTTLTGKTVDGKVQRVSDTVLVLRSDPDDLRLAAADVQRIARRGHPIRLAAPAAPARPALGRLQSPAPRKRSWIGRHPALFGSLVGFGGGFLIGYLPGRDGIFEDQDAAFGGWILGGVGAGAGALVGATVGAATR
jgi:hypothetical protein